MLEDIQTRIKKARFQKGFTQKRLGTAIGKTTPEIGDYEKGNDSPPLEVIFKIAEALSINKEWLLLGKPDFTLRKELKAQVTGLEDECELLEAKIMFIEQQQNDLRSKKKVLNKKLREIKKQIEILGG